MEVPGLDVESELELQLLAFATATATADLSFVYNLCCNLRQHWILKPLSEASDLTCIFMTLCWVFILLSHNGNSQYSLWLSFFMKCYLGLSLGNEETIQPYTRHLCMNWIMDAQWPFTDKLWNKWCDQPLFMMGIYVIYLVIYGWKS